MASDSTWGALGVLLVGGGFVLFLDYILHACGHRWFGFVDFFDPKCKFSVWGNLGLDAAMRQGGGGAGETQMDSDCATGSQGIGTCHLYPTAGNCFKATCSYIDGGKPYCICGPTCAQAKQGAINYCYEMAGSPSGGGPTGSGGGGGGIKHGVPTPPKHMPAPTPSAGQVLASQPVGTARPITVSGRTFYCWKGSCANPRDVFTWCGTSEANARQGFLDECHRRLGQPAPVSHKPPSAVCGYWDWGCKLSHGIPILADPAAPIIPITNPFSLPEIASFVG